MIITDADRYQYLRENCYKAKYPNSEFDYAMHLSFTVSGIWADNMNPKVLDSLIDVEIEKKRASKNSFAEENPNSPITAENVKRLREETSNPMMDCKRALYETNGDYDKAKEFLITNQFCGRI